MIVADAWRARLRTPAGLPHAWPIIRRAAAELGMPRRLPRCSLNAPAGARQRLTTATANLSDVRRYAHVHGGTVNDAVLAAIAGAVRTLLARRGERLPDLVVSVPVSARTAATATELGNQVGVMPVCLPTRGGLGWAGSSPARAW
ncbi:wax ester/triacylglycerol synthase domain-containing protein [Nonomuraea sp. NPDC001684]